MNVWDAMFLACLIGGFLDMMTTFIMMECLSDWRGMKGKEYNPLLSRVLKMGPPYRYMAYPAFWHLKLVAAIVAYMLTIHVSEFFGMLLSLYFIVNVFAPILNSGVIADQVNKYRQRRKLEKSIAGLGKIGESLERVMNKPLHGACESFVPHTFTEEDINDIEIYKPGNIVGGDSVDRKDPG